MTLWMRGVEFCYASTDFSIQIKDFRVGEKSSVFLRGPSGSGKTTLLSLASGLLASDTGEIRVADQLMPNQAAARDALRAQSIGIIHQQFNLLSYLDTLSNVLLPFAFRRGSAKKPDVVRARELLNRLGVPPHLHASPALSLSVGQQQRVAIARALVGKPALVVADEPTSALDMDTRDAFLDVLFGCVEEAGASLLMVSHDPAIAKRFDNAIDLRDIATVRSGEPQ